MNNMLEYHYPTIKVLLSTLEKNPSFDINKYKIGDSL